MKSFILSIIIAITLSMTSVVHAKPVVAKDSHGTTVYRVSLVEAKYLWDNFLEEDGAMKSLYEDYSVYGLSYHVKNPKTGEMEEIQLMTGQRHQAELTRAWDCVVYMSHDDRYNNTVAMNKNRKNNTADVYEPGTAAF